MITKFQPFQEERPWGYFREFCKNTPATVKIISVKPNGILSLQSHAKREEFWRVIAGRGVAQIGNDQREIKAGDEMIIPLETKHRLAADSESLEVLEVSLGEFDENDETRYEDKYRRT